VFSATGYEIDPSQMVFMEGRRVDKNRRRKYFLPRSPQPKLLLGIAFLILILVAIAGGLFYVLANKELSIEYYKAHSTLRYVMQNLLPWLLVVNLLAILVTLFLAIFYTHKIAGPVYRMQKDLRKIAQGKLTLQIKTRKKDQLKELESEINRMTNEFKQNLQRVKEGFSKLDTHLRRLEESTRARRPSDPEVLQILEEIKSCQGEISRRLSLFETE